MPLKHAGEDGEEAEHRVWRPGGGPAGDKQTLQWHPSASIPASGTMQGGSSQSCVGLAGGQSDQVKNDSVGGQAAGGWVTLVEGAGLLGRRSQQSAWRNGSLSPPSKDGERCGRREWGEHPKKASPGQDLELGMNGHELSAI